MKYLKDINIWRILKILCIVLCTVFLFTACGSDDDDATFGPGGDKQETLEAQRDCIQAKLLETMYSGLGKMADNVYKNLVKEDMLSLMILAFSVWMAYQILRHVSATSPESLGEFWTKVLRKATLCVACGLLVSSTDNIYYAVDTFVLPIYVTLLEFASAILKLLGGQPGADTTEIEIIGDVAADLDGSLVEPIKHKMTDSGCMITDSKSITWKNGGEFPKAPVNMMGCMACAVSDRLNVGYSISMLMIKSGNLFAVLVAIFLFLSFTIVKWGFALYLVDSIFRFTMMIIIMPFLIMFFPFEQTRKWTTVGFKVILNSAAIMLCLAMLIGMTVYAMESLLNNPDIGDFGDKETYQNFSTVPLSMMFMGFVIVKASGLAVSLSDSVTGGGGEARFQKKVAALVGTLANALFVVISMGASTAVSAAAAHSRRVAEIVDKVNKAKAKVDKIKQKMNQLAGRQQQQQNQGGEGEGGEE